MILALFRWFLGYDSIEIDRLGSRDGWAVMGAVVVTGSAKGPVYVMFGATSVGALVFLFWETSRFSYCTWDSLGERRTLCDCNCLGGILLSLVSHWQRSDAMQHTPAQGNFWTRKSIPTRERLHQKANYAFTTLATWWKLMRRFHCSTEDSTTSHQLAWSHNVLGNSAMGNTMF